MRSLCYPIDHKGTQTDKILNAYNNTISIQDMINVYIIKYVKRLVCECVPT